MVSKDQGLKSPILLTRLNLDDQGRRESLEDITAEAPRPARVDIASPLPGHEKGLVAETDIGSPETVIHNQSLEVIVDTTSQNGHAFRPAEEHSPPRQAIDDPEKHSIDLRERKTSITIPSLKKPGVGLRIKRREPSYNDNGNIGGLHEKVPTGLTESSSTGSGSSEILMSPRLERKGSFGSEVTEMPGKALEEGSAEEEVKLGGEGETKRMSVISTETVAFGV
jgi:hypothetical protein